eukprot:TRINITY_DN15192_c0_g2_i1.p1 TRINITY_DN15192_c0_g2~~TRINITY_DN15192_c0_g2_i1.p1  ORF type:complete len:204 (+),score=28.93 TRINITY_DN15192_c0_g2_i1:230-841(+)
MASGDSHSLAVSSVLPPTAPSNHVKRKLTPAAVVGVVVTLSVGALAFALGLAGLLSFTTRTYRAFNGFYYKECESKTALYLEWVSVLISFVGAVTASVFGGCPCCCYIRHYKKGITFSFSVVFLVLNWFCLGLTLVFRTRSFGIRVEDSYGCQRTTPEQLVAIVLTAVFGAAHIVAANLAYVQQPDASKSAMGVPIATPYVLP